MIWILPTPTNTKLLHPTRNWGFLSRYRITTSLKPCMSCNNDGTVWPDGPPRVKRGAQPWQPVTLKRKSFTNTNCTKGLSGLFIVSMYKFHLHAIQPGNLKLQIQKCANFLGGHLWNLHLEPWFLAVEGPENGPFFTSQESLPKCHGFFKDFC